MESPSPGVSLCEEAEEEVVTDDEELVDVDSEEEACPAMSLRELLRLITNSSVLMEDRWMSVFLCIQVVPRE